MAQACVDRMGAGLDSGLLPPIWRTKLSVLLRYWERSHNARAVDGEQADFLVAGGWAARLSNSLHS